jgi:hypothetical protein
LRGVVTVGVAALALVASACSSSSSNPPTSTSVVAVAAPADPLQGCTYTVNGKAGSFPAGKTPNFAAFSPDPSAEAALTSIKAKGGTGAVDTFELPGGTKLRSGPSGSAPVVGTVPGLDQLQLYDPIVWTDPAGREWLATFIACGGRNLYWAGLDDLHKTDSLTAAMLRSQLAQLRAARPYTQTAMASDLPLVLGPSGQLRWKDKAITFSVGRSELITAPS